MKLKITVTLVTAFSFLFLFAGCGKENSSEFSYNQATETESAEPAELVGDIYVYVCGAVQSPGVYGFLPDARVCDAISAADGFMDDAAREYLNQAEALYDGEKLYVPTEAELLDGNYESGTDAYSAIDEEGRVNINLANETELQTIVGIGQTRARAIIEYRDEHGMFSSIDEIKQVSGIGENTYQKIKDQICIN